MDVPDLLPVAERGPGLSNDLPVPRFQLTRKSAHARLVAEQTNHPLVVTDRAFVELEAVGEGDANPRVEWPVDLPVAHDPIPMRGPRADRPPQLVPKRRAQPVRHHDVPRAKLAGCRDHRWPVR